MGASDKRSCQVFRIFDNALDDEPIIAVGLFDDVEVLRHRRFRAVWNSVLLQVSRAHATGHDLQRPARPAAVGSELPLGDGKSLPVRRSRWRLRLTEAKQTRLCPRIRLQ